MVPWRLLQLPAMPLSANGKLDRKQLPQPEGQGASSGHVAPGSDAERALVAIWLEVLGLEQIGVTDSFFELGGHSLLATQIASRVQKVLQRNVPLRAMFECSTVEALAGYIDGLAANEISAEKVDRLSDLMAELEGF